jgi:hypothetical protein
MTRAADWVAAVEVLYVTVMMLIRYQGSIWGTL